jgi:uncharacterized protein
MPILIDGYNLLHATGIAGQGVRSGGLQQSRLALLSFLAASIDPAELPRTTIVFDAHDPPPGLPRVVRHRGMTVHFAARQQTADDLIAALIRTDSAPRRLVVVSSDHAIQRAARRRRAKAVDSDVWYADLVRSRHDRNKAASDEPDRPPVPLLEEDVDYWLRQFGNPPEFWIPLGETPGRPSKKGTGSDRAGESVRKEGGRDVPVPPFQRAADPDVPASPVSPDKEEAGQFDNPFPPGYGEDLLREL